MPLRQSGFITRKQLAALSGCRVDGKLYKKNPLKLGTPILYCGGRSVATHNGLVEHICIKEETNAPLPSSAEDELVLYRYAGSKADQLPLDITLLQGKDKRQKSIPVFWEPTHQPQKGVGGKLVFYVGHWNVIEVKAESFTFKKHQRCAVLKLKLDRYDTTFGRIIDVACDKTCPQIGAMDFDNYNDKENGNENEKEKEELSEDEEALNQDESGRDLEREDTRSVIKKEEEEEEWSSSQAENSETDELVTRPPLQRSKRSRSDAPLFTYKTPKREMEGDKESNPKRTSKRHPAAAVATADANATASPSSTRRKKRHRNGKRKGREEYSDMDSTRAVCGPSEEPKKAKYNGYTRNSMANNHTTGVPQRAVKTSPSEDEEDDDDDDSVVVVEPAPAHTPATLAPPVVLPLSNPRPIFKINILKFSGTNENNTKTDEDKEADDHFVQIRVPLTEATFGDIRKAIQEQLGGDDDDDNDGDGDDLLKDIGHGTFKFRVGSLGFSKRQEEWKVLDWIESGGDGSVKHPFQITIKKTS